jgi:hypothetical protein
MTKNVETSMKQVARSALIATGFMLVSCMAYFSTLKMEGDMFLRNVD